jgi:uncharacterized membrane protein YbhN (UPF0104 family)
VSDLPASDARASTLRRVAPRVAVSLLIAIGLAWAMSKGGLPIAPPEHAKHSLHWWGIPAFFVLVCLGAYWRTARWIYLLRPLSTRLKTWRVLGIGFIGFSSVFFAPLRLGEVVRPYLLSQDGEVTFVQAVGSVAAERIIDGLAVALITAAALWLSTPIAPLPNHVGTLPIPVSLVPSTVVFACVMFTCAFGMMALFYVARDQARRAVAAVLGVISPRLAAFGANLVERLGQGFGFLPSWQSSGPFLRNTVLYWSAMGLAQYALLRGVGLDCTVPQAFMTNGVVALGSLLPAGPGFFGTYQVAAYTSLALFHSEEALLTQGALFVFWSYSMHFCINLLVGVVGFVLLSRFRAEEPAAA